MDKESLEAAAGEIANLILAVDTDYRGNLFAEISKQLKQLRNTDYLKQLRNTDYYFTASMFEIIAVEYGMTPDIDPQKESK